MRKSYRIKFLFLAVFNLVLTSSAYMQTTYYVDGDNGDDSRSASQAKNQSTPWRTFYNFNHTRGEALLEPGDTIKFKSGTTISRTEQPNTTEATTGGESGAATFDYHWAWRYVRGVVCTTYGGTAKATIDGEGCDALNLGRVKIRDKNNKLSYSIGYSTSDSKGNGNEFHNLRFYSSSDIPWYDNDSYLVHVWDLDYGFNGSAHYTVFNNCEIDASKMLGRDEDNECFTLATSHSVIKNCYVHGTGVQRSGIYMNGEYNKVIGNTIRDFYSAGIKFNGGGKNGQVSHNLIIDGGVPIIMGEGAEYNNVFSNVIIWTSTGTGYKHSIELTGNKGSSDDGARFNKIVNNTVIINGAAGAVSALTMWGGNPNITGSGNGNEVKNNLFYIYDQSTAYMIRMYDDWEDPQESDYNLLYSDNNYRFYDDNGAFNGLSLWKSRYGTETHSVASNPLFNSHSTNSENPADYKLKSNSPAINAGTAVTLHNETALTDFYGNPVSGGVDIGAFQYQSVNPVSSPVANFSADNSKPTIYQTVTFTDASTNSPTSYQWTFNPTNISYMDGTNSTSKNPHIKFNSSATYSCTLRVSNSGGSDAEVKANFITAVGVKFDVSAILAGPYLDGIMKTTLNSNGFIPTTQSFNSPPWNYGGGETFPDVIPDDVVDWVLVDLRTGLDASTRVARRAGIIKNNGTLSRVNARGFYFSIPAGNYYIVVHQRNHLSVISSEKIRLNMDSWTHYDFTDSQAKAYGNTAMQDLGDGKFGLISGDGNSDGAVSDSDIQDIWIPEFLNSTDGYLQSDFDMDGSVTASDNNIHWLPNNGKSITFPK